MAPDVLPSFARQHITCRAATCHLLRRLTHQHTQRVTMRMSMRPEAEEMQTMATSAETHTFTQLSKPQILDESLITYLSMSKHATQFSDYRRKKQHGTHQTVCPRSWPPLECKLWLCDDRKTPGRCTGLHPALWALTGRPLRPLPLGQMSHHSWNTRDF